VSALIYMVLCAPPEMAATVGYLALTFPTKEMDTEADCCLRYTIDTPDGGITFDGARGGTLVAYSETRSPTSARLRTASTISRAASLVRKASVISAALT